MPLSRRQFLQLTGISIIGSVVGLPELPALSATYGRTLSPVPLKPQPQTSAPALRHLWPDTVLPITPRSDTWYQTGEGYVEKAHIQPLLTAATYAVSAQRLPFWAEVSAPVAAIREWCAADAPLITRVGHGGVMHLIDQLPGDPLWYGVADEHGKLLGWTPAPGWKPVNLSHTQLPLEIQIDQRRQQMRVASAGTTLIQAVISTGQKLTPGTYPLTRSDTLAAQPGEYHGASWPLHIGNGDIICGVYWHNRFGASVPGPTVQTPTYLARWLYTACGDGSYICIF